MRLSQQVHEREDSSGVKWWSAHRTSPLRTSRMDTSADSFLGRWHRVRTDFRTRCIDDGNLG